jgi:hypothetical protein
MFILYHNGRVRPLLKMNFFSPPAAPRDSPGKAGGASADPVHAPAERIFDVSLKINL